MNPRAPLRGLVLAGGFSRRFGMDKAEVRLQPDGQTAVEVMCRKLAALGIETAVSVRAEQHLPSVEALGLARVPDDGASAGPLSGLRAAFASDPSAAWLVVACDLYSLDRDTLARLVAARHPAAAVVAVRNPETRQPEPLCAIYEPSCAWRVRSQWEEGDFRLRHLLRGLPLAWISPARPDAVRNYNQRETLPPGLVAGFD